MNRLLIRQSCGVRDHGMLDKVGKRFDLVFVARRYLFEQLRQRPFPNVPNNGLYSKLRGGDEESLPEQAQSLISY